MGTGINCGQVRGPVQFSFARSIEPILPSEISITRMAATNRIDKQPSKQGADESSDRTDNRTMGRKYIVPYALYEAHGFVSANLAEKTGFSEDDLDILLKAIENMFEHDHSAARGEMTVRKVIVFKHKDKLGNAPSHKLFDLIKISRSLDGEAYAIGDKRIDNYPPARFFTDYVIHISHNALPDGVELIERL